MGKRNKSVQGEPAVTPIDEVHELNDDSLVAAAGGEIGRLWFCGDCGQIIVVRPSAGCPNCGSTRIGTTR